MKLVLLISAALCTLLGGGCADESQPPDIVFGTYHSGGGSDSAALEGTLVVKDGCLMARPHGGDGVEQMLAWDEGFQPIAGEDGEILVLHDGQRVGAVGEPISLGGGPIARASVKTIDGDPIPEECKTKNMFGVFDAEQS